MSATPETTVVRVPKAGEMVAARLRRQIVTGQLHEGDLLPSEPVLMEQFGVSRPTLREAFRILESEQIIHVRRGAHGGAQVLLPDTAAASRYAGTLLQYRGTTLADVYEARSHLESAAVAMLARERSAANLRRLNHMLAEGEALLDDPVTFAEKHDLEFHRLLMELSENQTMMMFLDILFSIIESHNEKFIREHRGRPFDTSNVAAAHNAHVKLVELIRQKDADEAVAFWREHLTQITKFMVQDSGETILDVLS
ncbi:GntR family transcriptional regulator [Candidatus Protofrankia californiensis]|uniref:GntR family transcriptional regulator n=1 Tax=Candidatus Protofrankia californiensis TaxID=1839754 RepID=A0A1C3P2T2_9ACTN|nr:GntR family transcriptional regulator [Candidatus Protofrankia californiensis]